MKNPVLTSSWQWQYWDRRIDVEQKREELRKEVRATLLELKNAL